MASMVSASPPSPPGHETNLCTSAHAHTHRHHQALTTAYVHVRRAHTHTDTMHACARTHTHSRPEAHTHTYLPAHQALNIKHYIFGVHSDGSGCPRFRVPLPTQDIARPIIKANLTLFRRAGVVPCEAVEEARPYHRWCAPGVGGLSTAIDRSPKTLLRLTTGSRR